MTTVIVTADQYTHVANRLAAMEAEAADGRRSADDPTMASYRACLTELNALDGVDRTGMAG